MVQDKDRGNKTEEIEQRKENRRDKTEEIKQKR